jgi:hypothetical protein
MLSVRQSRVLSMDNMQRRQFIPPYMYGVRYCFKQNGVTMDGVFGLETKDYRLRKIKSDNHLKNGGS